MLVLTRRIKESILIGDDIEVTLLDVCNLQAKIGIQANKQTRIIRKEIADKKTGKSSKEDTIDSQRNQ